MGYSSNDPRNYLAIGRQPSIDTEATSFQFLKYLSGGMNVEMETESVYEGGDGQDQGLHFKTKVKPDGEFDVYARPNTFAYLAAYAMGSAAAIAPPPSSIASHCYTPNATMPYLTIEQAWGGGNQIDRVSNALLTSFNVEGEAGAPWKLSVGFVAGGTPYYRDGAASALTAVLESGDPAMYAGGAYLIDGATSLDVRSFSYKFERNVDGDLFTNQVYRRKVIPLSRSLSLDMQVIWQDQALYKQIVYNGGSMVIPNLATGSFRAVRELTASQSIQLDIPNLRYTGIEVNRLDPDGQTVVLDVAAMAVKAGTGLTQVRANLSGVATAYNIYP